jgi:hypothetical protein
MHGLLLWYIQQDITGRVITMAKVEYTIKNDRKECIKPYTGTTQEVPFRCQSGCVVCATGAIIGLR